MRLRARARGIDCGPADRPEITAHHNYYVQRAKFNIDRTSSRLHTATTGYWLAWDRIKNMSGYTDVVNIADNVSH